MSDNPSSILDGFSVSGKTEGNYENSREIKYYGKTTMKILKAHGFLKKIELRLMDNKKRYGNLGPENFVQLELKFLLAIVMDIEGCFCREWCKEI